MFAVLFRLLTTRCSLAVEIPHPQQLGEADFRAQGLRSPRSWSSLLLPRLLQHRRRLPSQYCRLHHSWILLAECPIQRQQGR